MSDSPDEPPIDSPDAAREDATDDCGPRFTPVPLRPRRDGWTADRQTDFIHALAASGCVEEAARRVGMSAAGAYSLRAKPEASSFRLAWDAAIDIAMLRMSDAAISRAIHGVPVPHFYKGEKVGEHRHYDNRLTMWLLRYRDPVRYGKYMDRIEFRRHPEGPALTLLNRVMELLDDAFGCFKGRRSPIGPIHVDEDLPR